MTQWGRQVLTFELVEEAGLGKGPPGDVVDLAGRSVHGVFETRSLDTAVRMVANNGDLLDRWGYPASFRSSFASPMHGDMNFVLAHRSWLYRSRGAMRATHPMDAAVERVCRGRKPFALAATSSSALAAEWERRARRAGRAVRRGLWEEAWASGEPVHVVTVAARQPFGALFDLDTLAEDYASAGLGAVTLTAVLAQIDGLRGVRVADLIDDEELVRAVAPEEYVRAGLAFGYSPASTAAVIVPSGWHAAGPYG